jgi:hypothetical protein
VKRRGANYPAGAVDGAVPTMVQTTFLSGAFVLVLLVLESLTPISGSASADDLSFPSGQVLRASGGRPQGVEPSPSGCFGRSNNPHKDTEGTIKGLTQIDCEIRVASLHTTAQLWRKRWWGYQSVGSIGDNTNATAIQVKASSVYGACENNKWRTEGEHWSTEATGTYYAHTLQYADVDKC